MSPFSISPQHMAGHDPGDEPLPSKSTGRSGRIQLAVFLLLTAGVLWLVWLDSIPENIYWYRASR